MGSSFKDATNVVRRVGGCGAEAGGAIPPPVVDGVDGVSAR